MNRADPSNGPLVITEGQCFPPETELLTERGWIRFDQYSNEKVFCVNDKMESFLELPLAKIEKKYSGELWHIKKYNYATCMTPDHNVVYINNGGVHKRQLQDMPNTIAGGIPLSTTHSGPGIPLTDSQIRLFVAVSADGTLDKRTNGVPYVRIAFKKDRKIQRFENILRENDINYYKKEYENGYTFFGFRSFEWLSTKKFDHSWLALSTLEQKKLILDEIVLWDGNTVPNRNQVEYSSNVYENAKFIHTLSHLCGYSGNIIIRPKGNYKPVYKVSILYSKNTVSYQDSYKYIEKTQYDGMVYCVTVSTGMIMTRYKDHITVSGNCDALSVLEAGYKNVVSVPGGSANMKWIEECFEWLNQFDQFIIWSDADAPGIKMRKEAVARLGQWKCKYIEIPQEYLDENKEFKDANAILYRYGPQAVLDLIANAQEIPITGVVDLAEVDEFDIESASGIYTRIKPLDDVLYKILYGSVCVITGPRAAGKSSFVNQVFVCEALEQGGDIFLFSAELSTPVLKSWINLTMAGPENVTMKDKFVHVINKDAKKKMEEWYKGRVWIYDNKKDNTVDSVLDRAISVTRKYGAKIWIIDNLSVLDIGANDNNLYEKQKDLMTRLIGLADLYNVLIVLVAHPRKLQNGMEVSNDDVAGSASLTNLAQYVISVKRFTEKEKRGEKDGKGNFKPGKEPINEDVGINTLKNRYVGRQGEVRAYFDYRSRRFFISKTDLNKRYQWDKNNKSPQYDYDPLKDRTPF
jgi:KaiC/GvpD/RAD55 family RecA-like ATPase/5S rRNA maturation endonuclease (ribonuclease M5)